MCLRAAELLANDGVDAEVVHLASVKPIDADLIAVSARKTGAAVTAELATVNGGFGSAVAEVLGERCPVPLRRIGYQDVWPHGGSIRPTGSRGVGNPIVSMLVSPHPSARQRHA